MGGLHESIIRHYSCTDQEHEGGRNAIDEPRPPWPGSFVRAEERMISNVVVVLVFQDIIQLHDLLLAFHACRDMIYKTLWEALSLLEFQRIYVETDFLLRDVGCVHRVSENDCIGLFFPVRQAVSVDMTSLIMYISFFSENRKTILLKKVKNILPSKMRMGRDTIHDVADFIDYPIDPASVAIGGRGRVFHFVNKRSKALHDLRVEECIVLF